MKKEIKFRVWSNTRNMFIVDGITIKQLQDDATQSLELPMLTSEDCVWSQFIGITDVHGKEIYEGDFITFDPHIRFMGNCIWKNVGHLWVPDLVDGVQVSYNHPFSEQSDKLSDITLKYYTGIYKNGGSILKMRVVGNYFENPDLMESIDDTI